MKTIYGVDFGTGSALAIYGPNGPVSKKSLKLPRVKGGRTPAMEFIMIAEALLGGVDGVEPGDIVMESATIGSSGCEVQDMVDLVRRYPERAVYTISNRAVKNYRKDHPELGWKKGARYAKDGDVPPVVMPLHLQESVHIEDAEIIYTIATRHPERLYHWRGPSQALERVHSSVRPMDKHRYRNEIALKYLAMLPPVESLPPDIKDVVANKDGYVAPIVMPFAMATTEPFLDNGPVEERRKRYEKIIGLYDRGYPSFYRRATISWMHCVARRLANVTRIENVDSVTRKAAWKETQRQIRKFFFLTMEHQGR